MLISRTNANDWIQNYEKITDMIVPRSSQLITQDADYALFNVTLFKKVISHEVKSKVNRMLNGVIHFRSLKNSNSMLVRRSSLCVTSLTMKRSWPLAKMKSLNSSPIRRSNL